MSDYHANALSDALRRVKSFPFLAQAIRKAGKGAAAAAHSIEQAVMAEVGEFSASRNPDLRPELAQHCHEIVQESLRLLHGGAYGTLEFVQAHARRRAEQRFPMEATLHAYRCGQKVLSRWLLERMSTNRASPAEAQRATSAIVDFSMEFVDAISTMFASSYSGHALLLAEVTGDQRSELLRVLLAGHDEADVRVARLLREAGFRDERQVFCVALARSVDATEMIDASRARRMADAVDQIAAELTGARRVIDVRNNKVTMVFAAVSRDSGWTAPGTSLAKRIYAAMKSVGNAALIGISNDIPSTSHIPTAYQEADTALEHASVSERVVHFVDIPLRRLLLHFAAQNLGRVLPAWASALFDADDKSNGALLATLRAYARGDMNILKAADDLGIHPNTVYARLQRVFDISGLQPRSFKGLSDLLIVGEFDRGGALKAAGRR